jgi:hypothetical protein
MKATAKRLREEDRRKWTNARVAAALGIAESTVRSWNPTTNRNSAMPATAAQRQTGRNPLRMGQSISLAVAGTDPGARRTCRSVVRFL